MRKSVLIVLLCGILVLGVCGAVQAGNWMEQARIQQKQVLAYRGETVFCEVNAARGKEIYICSEDKKIVYRLTAANKVEQYPLQIPEGMTVAQLKLDENDHVQVWLETEKEYLQEGETYHGELWTADTAGNVLNTVVMTESFHAKEVVKLHVDGDLDAEEMEKLEEKFADLETPGEAEGEKKILGWHVLGDGKYLVIDTFMENGSRITQFSYFEEE